MRHPLQNCGARCGYTLPELMVGLSILSMLLLGTVSVFLLMLRLTGSVMGASLSAADASNAVQRVTANMREANSFTLLDDAANDAIDTNGNTVVTGITLTFPKPYVSSSPDGTVHYTTGAGVSIGPLTGTDAPYNVATKTDSSCATVSFYRANYHQPNGADGTPNPSSGNCLWVTGTENGVVLTPGPVIKTIASTADAVQFIVPYQPDGVTPITNEVEIKIISGQYDPVHGTVSSDSASGGATALTGECVYLRDHNPTPVIPGGANGKKVNYGG